MSVRDRLEQELQDVSFSKGDQERLKEKLRLKTQTRAKPSGIYRRLLDFWNGSIEIPLPVGIVVLYVIFLGAYKAYATIFVVDQSMAALLFYAGSESTRLITEGVSVL